MAFEIELKAGVSDHAALKSAIDSQAVFSFSFEKEDIYWSNLDYFTVRVRNERDIDGNGEKSSATWVTYKIKERLNGIEVNREHEFGVSCGSAFEDFLKLLDFEVTLRKKKRGFSWKYEDITVELADIERLGYFVELEILADNDNPDTISRARARLLDFLRKIGVSEDNIEDRYYAELLRELDE
jgi:adenylate cyclase class 2